MEFWNLHSEFDNEKSKKKLWIFRLLNWSALIAFVNYRVAILAIKCKEKKKHTHKHTHMYTYKFQVRGHIFITLYILFLKIFHKDSVQNMIFLWILILNFKIYWISYKIYASICFVQIVQRTEFNLKNKSSWSRRNQIHLKNRVRNKQITKIDLKQTKQTTIRISIAKQINQIVLLLLILLKI